MIIAIASETGWSEEYIRSGLPWARALLYWHAIAWRNGLWTVLPGDGRNGNNGMDVREQVERLKVEG
jgi:hypothetical protein